MRELRHIEKYEVTEAGEWLITLEGGFEVAPEVTKELVAHYAESINACEDITMECWLLTLDVFESYREAARIRTMQVNAEKLAVAEEIVNAAAEEMKKVADDIMADFKVEQVTGNDPVGMPSKVTFVPPVELIVKCIICGAVRKFMVMRSSLDSFLKGGAVDKCFPYLNAAQREMLISGICGKCWDKMFHNDEDMDS